MERQAERAQSTPRRSTSASLGGAGNPVALLMRVRKAAKTMEKRARVRKSTVEQNQPELLGEVSHSNTYYRLWESVSNNASFRKFPLILSQ